MFFLDHRGKIERMSPARFPDRDVSGDELSLRPDMVRLGSRNVSIAFHEDRVAFRGHAGSDETEIMSLFPPPNQGFDITSGAAFSYLGSAPMLVHFTTERSGLVRAGLFPFRADGAVLGPRTPAPTQGALVARYRGCSSQDRSTTTRVVAPAEPGSRRGVLIEGPDGSRFAALASAEAVLYGTADSPCGGAIEAVSVEDVSNRGDEIDRALISLSDLERSWFFRAVGDRVEARAMVCRITPGATLPPAVQRAVEADEPPRRSRSNPLAELLHSLFGPREEARLPRAAGEPLGQRIDLPAEGSRGHGLFQLGQPRGPGPDRRRREALLDPQQHARRQQGDRVLSQPADLVELPAVPALFPAGLQLRALLHHPG
jgi:hypothetical protein